MKVYQIKNDKYIGEPIFGLKDPFNKTNSEKKLIQCLKFNPPWNMCIPYYNKAYFAFISKDALNTVLHIVDFSDEDLKELNDHGWYIKELNISIYSLGLSKTLCTFFSDEIIEDNIDKYTFEEFYKKEYNLVPNNKADRKEINHCKNFYYNNVITYYEF